jgi:glycosyltransferase involved in cell wall biosynthesis
MSRERRPVRVVRIIARLNTGGPAIHTILLTHGLDPTRFTSTLLTGAVDPFEGDMGYYAESMGVKPVIIPGLGRHVGLADLGAAFVRLWRWLRTARPAIIHTHTATAGGLGRLAGVLYNVEARLRGWSRARLVHTFHGHVFHGYFPPLRSRAMVLVERLLAGVTDRVVAVSDEIAHDLVTRYRVCSRAKLEVVPLGLDFAWVERLGDCEGDVRKRYGIPPSTVTVALVGRMTRIKNHTMLLGALSRLRGRDLRAIFIGDGELRAEIEAATAAAGLSAVVIFTGWEPEQARIYADIDIVCLTSRNEGTPVALIEAMAAGKPFISTKVGGVGDLMVGEATAHPAGFEVFANGVLVAPDDETALAAGLSYLADRPAVRAAMGAVGQAAVLKRFSKERLVQDIEAMYETLLAKRSEEVRCGR